LQKNKVKDKEGTYVYGFSLTAHNQCYEFSTFSLADREEWVRQLKSSVILLDVNFELEVYKKVIG
jgi:calcium/calmodulin-dependent protein kinase I